MRAERERGDLGGGLRYQRSATAKGGSRSGLDCPGLLASAAMRSSVVVSLAPRGGFVVAAADDRVWVRSGGETLALLPDGQVVQHFRRLELKRAFEQGGRWLGVAGSASTTLHELDRGKRLFELDGDVVVPLDGTRVLAYPSQRSPRRCTIHALPAGERVGTFELAGDFSFAASEDTLFVAATGTDSILTFDLQNASPRDAIRIAPRRLGRGALIVGRHLLVGTTSSLLWIDPSSRTVIGEHELSAGERIYDLQVLGDGVLVLTHGSLYLARRDAPLVPLVEYGAGSLVFNDGRGWIVDKLDSGSSPVFAEDASAKPKTLALRSWMLRGAVAGHAVFENQVEMQVAFVPLDARPGEQTARVVSAVSAEPRELIQAQVIDNPHNYLRLRTATHPLLELRTGPLGLGPDAIVRVGSTGLQTDRGRPLLDVLEVEEGGVTSRRLRTHDAFVNVPASLSIGTVAPHELPPLPPLPRAVIALRVAGLIANEELPPAQQFVLAREIERLGRRPGGMLADTVLNLLGPGPDVHVLRYEYDELHLLPSDLREIVPRLAFEASQSDDELVFSSPSGRVQRLELGSAAGPLLAAMNEALTEAGADRVLFELETLGGESFTVVLAPPRVLDALEKKKVRGIRRAP